MTRAEAEATLMAALDVAARAAVARLELAERLCLEAQAALDDHARFCELAERAAAGVARMREEAARAQAVEHARAVRVAGFEAAEIRRAG